MYYSRTSHLVLCRGPGPGEGEGAVSRPGSYAPTKFYRSPGLSGGLEENEKSRMQLKLVTAQQGYLTGVKELVSSFNRKVISVRPNAPQAYLLHQFRRLDRDRARAPANVSEESKYSELSCAVIRFLLLSDFYKRVTSLRKSRGGLYLVCGPAAPYRSSSTRCS